MCGNIEMEVPFMKYTANYLCRAAKIVCSVLHKWYFHFYLFPHSDFGFFSCVAYLPSKLHITDIKTPYLDLDLNDLPHIPGQSLLKL